MVAAATVCCYSRSANVLQGRLYPHLHSNKGNKWNDSIRKRQYACAAGVGGRGGRRRRPRPRSSINETAEVDSAAKDNWRPGHEPIFNSWQKQLSAPNHRPCFATMHSFRDGPFAGPWTSVADRAKSSFSSARNQSARWLQVTVITLIQISGRRCSRALNRSIQRLTLKNKNDLRRKHGPKEVPMA